VEHLPSCIRAACSPLIKLKNDSETHRVKDCLQIVDFFHALEHAGHVLDALIGKSHPDYKKLLGRWTKRLLKDKVQSLIKEVRQQCAGKPQSAAVEQALG